MKSVWNYYYSVTKRLLLLAGQWPYQRRRERLLRVTVTTMISITYIIPQIGRIIQCDRNVQCLLMISPSYLMVVIVLVKVYACHFNNSKIKHLTDQVYNDWENIKIPEEYEIMKTYAAKAGLFSAIYTLYVVTTAVIFYLISLTPQILDIILPLNESRPILLPYEGHYFVDDTQYYFYILFHAIVGSLIICPGPIAHDCLIVTYIEHIRRTSGKYLLYIFYDTNIISYCIDEPFLVYSTCFIVKSIAQFHVRYLHIFQKSNHYSYSCSSARASEKLKCTYRVLEIARKSDDIIEAGRYMAFVISQLIHLFCFSLQGQKLLDHSQQICDKIYNGLWYKIPVKSQRMLLHVMRKCLQPNFLTAGKIYIFSLKSFSTVLQTSMSYFTMLESFE
ncbi:hypothetical protein ACFW04_007122 [Cataglyphis niger]